MRFALAVFLLLSAGHVQAQLQTRDQRGCAIKLHKDLFTLATLTSNEWLSCIKDQTQGKIADVEACVDADRKSKLAKARQKTLDNFEKKCTGQNKKGEFRFPPFGADDPNAVNDAVAAKEDRLFHAIMGSDLDAALADVDLHKCQLATLKVVRKCQRMKLKEYSTCHKQGLKDGFQNETELQDGCLGTLFDPQPDPKGKIAKICNPATGKIPDIVGKKCAEADLAASFPGCNAASQDELSLCLDRTVECEVCRVLNIAGGLNRDCDLFDDGSLNGTCGDRAFPALDALQFPERRLGPIRDMLAELIARSSNNNDLEELLGAFLNAEDDLDNALTLFPEGELKRGFTELGNAGQTLASALGAFSGRIEEILKEPIFSDESNLGDSGPQGERLSPLFAMEQDLQPLVAELSKQVLVYEQINAASGPTQSQAGVIMKINDADRRVRLATGEVIGLRRSDGTQLDANLSITSSTKKGLGDGSSMFESVAAGINPALFQDVSDCIELRVAPVQPFEPFFDQGKFHPFSGEPLGTYGRKGLQAATPQSDPYVAHKFVAYENANALGASVLEQGMRLIAFKKPCLGDFGDTQEDFHRYSIEIEAVTSAGNFVLATQLEPADNPVGVIGLPTEEIVTFDIKYKRQHCTHLPSSEVPMYGHVIDASACTSQTFCPVFGQWDSLFDEPEPDPYDCEAAEVETDSVNVYIREQGAMCSANYSTTTFSFEDHDLASVAPAQVTSMSLQFGITGSFIADGDSFTATVPIGGGHYRGFRSAFGIVEDQNFSVHAWEPCFHAETSWCHAFTQFAPFPTAVPVALQRGGTDRPSALRWPRVVGNRNGDQFAYSCKLPSIVRDRINICPGVDQYFRLPMPISEGDIDMGQGQGACTCNMCMGCACTHAVGCTQDFALDILGVNGSTPLVAARGGRVDTVVNNRMGNCWQQPTCPQGNWGNWVRIEHQDGTSASYQHMPFMAPTVVVNQRVWRGMQIGVVGNVGNSSDPHTHFQVETNINNNVTVPLAMEFELKNGNNFDLKICDVPERNDVMRSTH